MTESLRSCLMTYITRRRELLNWPMQKSQRFLDLRSHSKRSKKEQNAGMTPPFSTLDSTEQGGMVGKKGRGQTRQEF